MTHWINPSDLQPVSRQEAHTKAVDYCKGKLVGHNLEVFKERFQASLRATPTLFDVVKKIILNEVQSSKHLERVLEVIDLVVWLLELNLSNILDFWTVNIESIRNLRQRFNENGSWYNNIGIGSSKPKTNDSLLLSDKVALIELLIQNPTQQPMSTDTKPATDLIYPNTFSIPSTSTDVSTTKCSTCKKKNTTKKLLVLNQLTECKHVLCDDCLRSHCLKMLEVNNVNIQCPYDFTPIDRKLILPMLDKHNYQKYALIVQQNSRQSTNLMIQCPTCFRYVLKEDFLAECTVCKFTFCTLCRKSYHGSLDCAAEIMIESPADSRKSSSSQSNSSYYSASNDDQDTGLVSEMGIDIGENPCYDYGGAASLQAQRYGSWTNCKSETKSHDYAQAMSYAGVAKSQPQDHVAVVKPQLQGFGSLDKEQCNDFGAIAKPHEIEYYSNGITENTFLAEEISAAFANCGIKRQLVNWPWEEDFKSHRVPPKMFRKPFSSLNDGEWVEDVVLEDAMKNIVRRAGLEYSVAVLESYIMRWAMQKNYDDTTFCSLVREKHLIGKSVIAALINTDLNGCGGHWILGLVDVPNKRIILMDSSIVASSTFYQKYFFYLLHVMHISYELAGIKHGGWNDWELFLSLNSIQQTNIIDCGPITVANFYAAICRQILEVTPQSYRLRRWIHEIVSAKDEVPEVEPDKNLELVSSVAETKIDIQHFRPTGLCFTYRDTKQLVSELEFSKSTYC